jgi:outer membrane protein OmpA-like peptidoglycan-associated protein
VDPGRVRVFPVAELRALFRDTPLELPPGIGPPLALELGGLLGADAVLYGSVEGRSQDSSPELLVNVRLTLVSEHRLVFARTVLVMPATGERTDSAVRRAVVAAASPALSRLGDAGKKRCFDADRTRSLRKLALAEGTEAKAGADAASPPGAPPAAPAVASASSAPPPAASPASAAALRAIPLPPPPRTAPPARPAAVSRTPRQTEWARRLAGAERFVVDDVLFAGRSSDLQRDVGLADLAVALLAEPSVKIRLEGFVDTTADPGADRKLSAAMAQAAAKELVDLGVPRDRVSAAGRGGESPRLPNFTARGRAANRRVEAVAVP